MNGSDSGCEMLDSGVEEMSVEQRRQGLSPAPYYAPHPTFSCHREMLRGKISAGEHVDRNPWAADHCQWYRQQLAIA